MSTTVPSPVPVPDAPHVLPGPALLDGIHRGPSLTAHRAQYGEVPRLSSRDLAGSTERLRVRGRGGAGFPFAIKLRTAAEGGRRPVVVVNLSEGEPASAKDGALALHRPHLILDGAVATALALGGREVHVVVARERPRVASAMRAAVGERQDGVRITVHTAEPRFVAGQARAVLELMAGRPNLPVTSWAPEAARGHRNRPTLLSNAETWAQVGRLVHVGEEQYAAHGTETEPGTALLTLSGPTPTVREVPYGTPFADVLPDGWTGRPILLGGFHGAWLEAGSLDGARISVDELKDRGTPLGAGVMVCPAGCPVTFTSRVTDYLASQSAGRCGPCFNGLPALATAVRAVADGTGGPARIEQLASLVVRRGACAHPDGTVRLVRSLLAAFPQEVAAHGAGRCDVLVPAGVLA